MWRFCQRLRCALANNHVGSWCHDDVDVVDDHDDDVDNDIADYHVDDDYDDFKKEIDDDDADDVAHANNKHMSAADDDDGNDGVVDDHVDNDVDDYSDDDDDDYSDDDDDEVDVADAANIGGQQRCGRLFQIASHYSSTALMGGP